MKKLVLLSLVLFLISSCYAFEIKPFKQSYFAGETFQVEIIGNFTGDLTINNIHFYKNNIEQFPAFFFVKISGNQYFVYFDLQSYGNYSIEVKNALYYENNLLKGDAKKSDFLAKKTFVSEYISLENQVKQSWGSVEENALALLALSYNSELSSSGKTALLSKGNSECWPSANCNVKDTSLALLALSKLGQIDSTWLVDSQNNLDLGSWSLSISSSQDQSCILNISNVSQTIYSAKGSNSIDLDLTNKANQVTIIISCPSSFTPKLIHTYLGKLTEFSMNQGSSHFNLTLNNSKCFGKGYRSTCDSESSAYALLALNALKFDKKGVVDWLKLNAATTKEKAITDKFSSFQDWLEDNQHNRGYWSNSSLSVSQNLDIESTIFTSYALSERASGEKGKNWVSENIVSFSIKNKALALYFLFPFQDMENIVSVNPAFVKPGQKLEIILKNNGIRGLNVSSKFLVNKEIKNIFLDAGKSAKISFTNTNSSAASSSIEISYSEKTGDSELQYTIPILFSNVQNDTIIIINNTQTSTNFKFVPEYLNLTLEVNRETKIAVQLKDLSNYPVKNLNIKFTRDFAKILKIEPGNISKISSGSSKQIELIFTTTSEGKYNGEIEASSFNVSAKLILNLTVTKNASQVNIPNGSIIIESKNCSSFNGIICKVNEKCSSNAFKNAKDSSRCCVGKCSPAAEKKPVGLALIGLASIILIIFLLSRLKKPKKEMKNYIEDIEEKYSAKPNLKKVRE